MEGEAIVPQASWSEREQMCHEVQQLVAAGEGYQALKVAEDAEEQFKAAGDAKGEASALFMQTLAQAKMNDDDPGATLFVASRAMAALKETGEKAELAACSLLVGELYCANGELDEATRTTREAMTQYEELYDQSGAAACHVLLSDLHLMRQEPDDAMDQANRAYAVFTEADDPAGRASALHKMSRAHKMNGQALDALRTAESASNLWATTKDTKAGVQAAVAEAEAKLMVVEERDEKADVNVWVMNSAQAAAKLAKKWRKHDHVCCGTGLLTYAKALLASNGLKACTAAAKEACKCFRKAGLDLPLAQATLVWATAEYRNNLLEDAQERAGRATALFERVGDEDGKAKCLELDDDIKYCRGQPTRQEIAEQQRLMLEQQQQFMMMQQQQFAGMQQQQMQMQQMQQQQWQPQAEEVAVQSAGGGGFQPREGAPLELSAGMDPAIIRNKVAELAGAIIGDTEDLEVDTPLMEAGLTSNSAVLLRDELSKDLPGISLPPTLIFDYPSIAAISEFVVEGSKRLKK